jgi:phosphoribosyl 1,2-cyclic phosphate phosphodiesterase
MGTDMDWRWLTANLPRGVEPGQDGQILEIPEAA